jgi:ABC-type phosphate transport system substrate-binding protein
MNKNFISTLFFNLLFFTLVFCEISQAEPLVLIVNKSNPTENLTITEVKRIFQGRDTRWIDGQKILVINQILGTTARQDFFRVVLDLPPNGDVISPGHPTPFKSLELLNTKDVIRFVSQFPNAIGYAPATQIPNDHNKIKQLRVSGFIHSEAGYPLK